MPIYSVCTWALYSLAMPTSVIYSLYFNNLNIKHPKLMQRLKILLYIPAIGLSIFFPPLTFREYQLNSLPFWITYAVYNLSFGVAFTYFMTTGVRTEEPGGKKMQKKYVRLITLPPVLLWLLSVFLTHPFKLEKLFKLWQANAALLFICIIIFIAMAFKDGLMGLRLIKESYNWNSDMDLVNKGAEYTNHMLKNQTAKSEIIRLSEKSYNLKQLLESALPVSRHNLCLSISIPDNIYCSCDKEHMTEVFSNLTLWIVRRVR